MTEEVLFHAVLAQPEADRVAYLAAHCTDPDLRKRVEALLAAHAAGGPLDQAATGAFVPGPGTSEPPPAAPEGVGTRIGPYKLMQQIGEGGMGAVWMAEQEQPVRRRVALKLIKPGMDSAQVIARFEAERQALALMDHQNIARVLDAGTTAAGRPYFVMELVKGVPITRYCDEARLTPRERLELFIPVCQAVQHAHQKGIIHRDLKPSNVLVTLYDGRPVPKVIDFGVAKALHQRLTDKTMFTEFGAVVGTFEYMAPEQAELSALDVDTRADVYALGVLLYELLTGTTPFDRRRLKAAAFDELLRIIREEEPPKPSTRLSGSAELPSIAAQRKTEPAKLSRLVRGEIDWIVMRALEKDRGRRYETANGFARDVQRYLADETVEACPPSAVYWLRKFAGRHKGQVLAASLVLLVLSAGLAGTTWGLIREGRANANLAAKNAELADEQAKVEARFALAQKAIAKLHTGVGEDMLLRSDQFKGLRTQLLKEAADFYADLEKLLEGQADVKSRRLLADGYFQLADLTGKIGTKLEAVAVHRKALAIRRELAAAAGADVETRLDVARSLGAMGYLLLRTGDDDAALPVLKEQHDLAAALMAESPTEAVQAVLAQSLNDTGLTLYDMGKTAEALAATEKAVAILRKLVEANPGATELKFELARSLITSDWVLEDMVRYSEALAASKNARAILEELAEANPAVTRFKYRLASTHQSNGNMFCWQGKPTETLASALKARAITLRLTDTYPGVFDFQYTLSGHQSIIGWALAELGRPAEAMAAHEKGLAIDKKLADANPTDVRVQSNFACSYNQIGDLLAQIGKPGEALQSYEKALAILRKQARDYPASYSVNVQVWLAYSLEKTGLLLSASGKPAEALAACEEALAILQKLSDAQPALNWWRGDLASSLTALGTVQRRAGRPAEAERAMTALRRAYSGGFGIAHLQTDAALAPLRGRADYAELLWDLADQSN